MLKVWKSAIGIVLASSILLTTGARASTLLSQAPAADARVVRLTSSPVQTDRGKLVVSAISPAGGKHVDIYLGDELSHSFAPIGKIDDPAFASGLCCGTLFELPEQIGSLPKGALLWAASVGQNAPNRRMAIKVYVSEDEGRTWRYSSEIDSPNQGGLWEPEFTVDRSGTLVMFFSDETDKARHSQTIRKARSDDGTNWRDIGYVVASDIQADRPGMPVTRRLANGRWMMTYELGGPAHFIVYYRLSDDGWNWGTPSNVGNEIRLPNGAFPAHAPRFTVMPDGAIALVGQLVETPNLKLGARNGRVLLENAAGDPATPWRTLPAPVPVPDACSETCPDHQWCPNYSSALLPSADGTQVLEFASHWTSGACMTSYGWGAWRNH